MTNQPQALGDVAPLIDEAKLARYTDILYGPTVGGSGVRLKRVLDWHYDGELSQCETARLLLMSWTDFDCVGAFRKEVLELLDEYQRQYGADLPFVDQPERTLPQRRFKIYRGASREEADWQWYGLSWTLDKLTAIRFATEFHRHKVDEPVLLQTRVVGRDVFAFLTARDENEVVINPDRFQHVVKVTELLPLSDAHAS